MKNKLIRALAISLIGSMLFTSCGFAETADGAIKSYQKNTTEDTIKANMLKEVELAKKLSQEEEIKAQAAKKEALAKYENVVKNEVSQKNEASPTKEEKALSQKKMTATSGEKLMAASSSGGTDSHEKFYISPYQIQNSANEDVSLSSGTLNYTYTISNSVLPLQIRYTSDNETYNKRNNNATPYTIGSSKLGVGWEWNIPSIDVGGKDEVHLRNGETLYHSRSYGYLNADKRKGELGLDGYTLIDKALYDDRVHYEGDDGVHYNGDEVAFYRLEYKTGEKVYFNEKGRALCEMDRYGNKTFTYGYTYLPGTSFGDSYPALTSITDSIGRVTQIVYTQIDSTHKKVEIINPDQTKVTLFMEEVAMSGMTSRYSLTKIIDPLSRETTFAYDYLSKDWYYDGSNYVDRAALLKSITYPTGGQTKYTYIKYLQPTGPGASHECFNIQTREDLDGTISYNKKMYTYIRAYMDRPNSVSVTNEAGLREKYTFDSRYLNTNKEIFKVVDTNVNNDILLSKEENTYSTDKLLTRKITTTYNATDSTKSRTSTETYTYDRDQFDDGDLRGYTGPEGNFATYEYDPIFHQKTSEITPKGTITYAVNSKTGNVDTMTRGNLQVAFMYDTRGNVTKQTSKDMVTGKTRVEDFEYSTAYNGGYLTKKSAMATDSSGTKVESIEHYSYDFNTGQLRKTIHPNGQFTTYEYDTVGRKTAETPPQIAGSAVTKTTIGYNDTSQITTVTDETGYSVQVKYDTLGHELERDEKKADGTWPKMGSKEYDSLGRVKTSTNALGDITKYDYDVLNRVVTVTNPDNTTKRSEYYDGDGCTVSYDEENSSKATYLDLKGRTIREEVPAGSTKYEYNPADKVTTTTDANGNVQSYSYDAYSNLTQSSNVVDGKTLSTNFAYDAFFNLTKTTYPKGNTQQNVYDELGRVVSTTDSLGKNAYTYYNAMDII